jgi:4-hydroxy-tetrahydrodipicolinate reductase
MKIALLGYGKMGKIIEQYALNRGHTISFKIDVNNKEDRALINPENSDAAIEFSSPHSAYENLKYCMNVGLKTVSGTTGWLEHRKEIEELCLSNGATFFYASNYSVGVNLFFKLNRQLAKLMAGQPHYEISSSEIHHTEKLDAPSGTAITLAEGIMENISSKNSWVNQEIPKENEVPIWSSREGKVPGTHIIKYISDVDEIEISHVAKNRNGFALGAVLAAEWVQNQKGVVGMEQMLAF